MKQNLRFRGCYCPKRIQPIYLFIYTLFLLTGGGGKGAFAQTPQEIPENIAPLHIGDTIPEWLWHQPLQVVNHPDGKNTVTLGDYRGKSIIIDFWSTWCGSCLAGFPKMDSLASAYPDELAVLLVNTRPVEDTHSRVAAVLGRLELRQGFRLSLPYVLGDTVLRQVFPHRTIPHHVWIRGDGTVSATTHAREVTAANVARFMHTGIADVRLKRDLEESRRNGPLLDMLREARGNQPGYASLIGGYVEGLSGNGLEVRDDGSRRFYRFNASLAALYNEAFREERGNLPASLLVFELPESCGFRGDYLRREDYANSYCYELTVPDADRERIRRMMREDLGRYFNVGIVRAVRPVAIYRLGKGAGYGKLHSRASEASTVTTMDGVTRMTGVSLSRVANTLNSHAVVHIVDGISGNYRLDLELPPGLSEYTPVMLKDWLEASGFSVTEDRVELDVAIFVPYHGHTAGH